MRQRADLWILLVLAFGLRLAHVADIRDQPVFSHPLVDAATYDDLARKVAARGLGAIETPYYQPPLYPMLLGAVYAATGGSYVAPRALQALLGVLTVALVVALAGAGGGGGERRHAGWIAGGLLAVYGPVLYFEGELLPPSLLLFLQTAALLLLARADGADPRGLRRLAAGFLLGITCAVRPTGFLLAAGAAVWWWAGRRRAGARAALRETATLVAAILLPVLPFTLANTLRGGEPILVSWNGGINFYVGNGANSDSLTAIQPGYRWDKLQVEPFRDGVRASRRKESDYWVRRTLREIAADRGAWAAALGRKALRLVDARETPRNTDWEDFRRDSRLLSLPLAGFGLVAPLALLGAILAFASRGDPPSRLRSLLGVQLAAVAAQNLLFFVADRYRLEGAPALCVLAGLGADELIRRRGRIGWRAAIATACAVVVVHVDFLGERRIDETRSAIHRAVALEHAGLHESAKRKLEEALRHDPDDVDANRLLGDGAVRDGDPARALAYYDRALAGAPDYLDALLAKARLLDQLGRLTDAELPYRRAIEADPYSARARLLYGVHCAVGRRWEEARAQFEAGLRIDPTNEDLRENLRNLDRVSGGS